MAMVAPPTDFESVLKYFNASARVHLTDTDREALTLEAMLQFVDDDVDALAQSMHLHGGTDAGAATTGDQEFMWPQEQLTI